MEQTPLWIICINAFVAVLILLGVLATGMRLLTSLFPEKPKASSDPAWAAAITGAVSVIWPGARVTDIQEIKGDASR